MPEQIRVGDEVIFSKSDSMREIIGTAKEQITTEYLRGTDLVSPIWKVRDGSGKTHWVFQSMMRRGEQASLF